MKWLVVLLAFLITTETQALTCYSTIQEARQIYRTEHLYYQTRKDGICWHINRITSRTTKTRLIRQTIDIQVIPIPRSNPLETPTQAARDYYRLTPEQGSTLLDMLFPELPFSSHR